MIGEEAAAADATRQGNDSRAWMRRDVERLAGMVRDSAGAGERQSARWLARRLEAAGAQDIEVAGFRYQHSFGSAHAVHFAIGLLGAGLSRRWLAAAALLSFEFEYSGRRQWLRRMLPTTDGANVSARLPARGRRRRSVVLVAHHDAAHTGVMWDPRLQRAGDRRAARTGRRPSLALLPELALALGAVSSRRLSRWGAAIALGAATALAADVTRRPTVPGANDNATGVAAVLALVERLVAERPDGLEVVALLPGCEESGMGGMRAWLQRHRHRLDPSTTLVLGLDTIGSGEPVVLGAEGGLWPVTYRDADVRRALASAARAGVAARPWRLGGWTDPALARLAGLPSISVVSVRDGGFPNYHRPSDIPADVDWDCVQGCLDWAAAIVEDWSR